MSGRGRRARAVRWLTLIGVMLLVAALIYSADDWRRQAVRDRPMLPTLFEHAQHTHTQCADCHHNWLDDTGGGPCYMCHKTDPEVSYQMEPMFHEFCWGCHIDKRLEGEEETGPLRECALCHPADL